MKPLSVTNYFIKNKKSFISSIIAISLSVIIIYGLECFLSSMYKSDYNSAINIYEKASKIFSDSDSKVIPENVITTLKGSDYIDRIVPIKSTSINFITTGNVNSVYIYGFLKEDRDYVVEKYNVKLKEGRYPEEGKKEIALDYKVALNNKLKLGSKYEEFDVVGILNSAYYLSISSFSFTKDEMNAMNSNPSEFKEKATYYSDLVFPKEGLKEESEELIKSIPDAAIDHRIYSEVNSNVKQYMNTSEQIFNILTILIIIVSVVTLACTKYTAFINRKSEYGILNSLGFSRYEVMQMAFKEVIILNFIGFLVGMCIAVIISYFLTKLAFEDIGGCMIFWSEKGFILSILTPLFSSVFSLIPIFRSLSRLDGITIIEEV